MSPSSADSTCDGDDMMPKNQERNGASAAPFFSGNRQKGTADLSSRAEGGPVASILVDLLGSAQSALARNSGEARELITAATAILTAAIEMRREAAADSSPAVPRNSALAPWQKQRVLRHIEANLDGPIKIEDLARVARLSASYFAKAFRDDFGRSPHVYIVDQRIGRAKDLTLTTDKSLAGIA